MSGITRRDFMVKAPLASVAATYPQFALHEANAALATPMVAEAQSTAANAGQRPFSREELLSPAVRDSYEGDLLDRVAFPMGGIGTGCISLSGTGKLIDWEIFNNPNRGYQPYFSFLSLWAQEEGSEPTFRVLEGQLRGSLEGPYYITRNMWPDGNGCGPQPTEAVGLPRM